MTPADRVRRAVAEACGIRAEEVMPENSLWWIGLNVQAIKFWSLLERLTPEMPVSAALALRTVSDLIRYVEEREAREVGCRG